MLICVLLERRTGPATTRRKLALESSYPQAERRLASLLCLLYLLTYSHIQLAKLCIIPKEFTALRTRQAFLKILKH